MKSLATPVSGRYGAPMGRPNYTLRSNGESVETIERGKAEYLEALRNMPHRFQLQRAPLDAGGYDAGGAYWGHGERVYLARSENGRIFRSFRAWHRKHAFRQLREEFPHATASGFAADITKRDGRYSVTYEYCGQASAWMYVARFCGRAFAHCSTRADALRAANRHDIERLDK
jgi:hypothetical protein